MTKTGNIVWLILALALVSLLGHPFEYAERNSGRYLVGVVRAADPGLLADDPVADALGRFGSLFYRGIGWTFRILDWPPERIEPAIGGLYVATKLALSAAIVFLALGLRKHLGFALLLAAWCAQPRPSPLGGDTLWKATMTHATLASVLLVVALGFLVRGRELGFWLAAAAAVLVHPLDTLHLSALAIPALILARPKHGYLANLGARWVGLGVFLAACLIYAAWLAPPALSAEEARLFMEFKGGIGHVSPLAQPFWGWVKMTIFTILAWAALRTEEAGELSWSSRWLSLAILSGLVCGLVLSIAALVLDSATLFRLQPLRILPWTYFLVFLSLALAAADHLQSRLSSGPLLCATLLLVILDSLWALPTALLALVAVVATMPSPLGQFVARWASRRTLGIAFALLFGAMIAGWLLRPSAELEFLDSPWPWVTTAPLLALLIRPEFRRQTWVNVGVAITVVLVGQTLKAHLNQRERQDQDWHQVRLWCRENTESEATFLTPPAKKNFRTVAFRTTVSEDVSAIAWVDPVAYRDLRSRVTAVARARAGDSWNLDRLARLAAEFGADYLVTDGPVSPEVPSLHRQGPYRVWRLREPNPATSQTGPEMLRSPG